MQLIYRGSTYSRSADSPATPDLEATGCYRGAAVHFKTPLGVSQPQTVAKLTYRGIPYIRIS